MKRLLAILLALVMILSMIPMTAIPAFAEEYLISDEAPAEEPAAPVEEPIEEPTEAPVEESTEASAEEPTEAPTEKPDKKNAGSGVCSGHVAGTVNGTDCCLAEDGTLHVCAINFPDANFRNYILEVIDTDGTGYLNADELAVTDISCYNREIASLQGIEYFADLEMLQCDGNSLTTLNVSANTALSLLDCSFNNLTELDVSSNTALGTLNCAVNNLTELDVSANTALYRLSCNTNSLTELDVSSNIALTYLSCYSNSFTELDLSANTALENLYCEENQLTELDVSNNTALQLLYADGNALTELDLSNNTAIEELRVSSNPIGALDVSGNTLLTDIHCYNSGLTSLDVSNNTALEYLRCSSNNLTSLDVSANTELVDLICSDNALTELILPEGYGLQHVYTENNQLTELDLSGVLNLEWLDVSGNQLTKLDLTNNTNLYSLDCSNNSLTQLDLPADAGINDISCDDQYWYGELPVSLNAQGQYHVDLTGITDATKISNVLAEGSWLLDPNSGILALDFNPNENGFTYEYATGFMDHTMTVNVNMPLSGSDDDGGDEEDPEHIVLEIPAIEDMTQLFLEEEAVVQWQEGDGYKWFYFVPEEDMEITFLTTVDMNAEDHLDPWAAWTDAEGNVIVYNDDDNALNSAIYVECTVGETYFFAVRDVNSQAGPLPVVILQGDQTQSGSGDEPGYEDNFSDIAPSIEEMTALTLDTDYTANIENSGDYAWFTFTPSESGTYSFFSNRGENTHMDPYGYLLNADLEIIESNDDGAGSLNFALTCALEAGQTYVMAAKALGDNTGSYTVRVAAAQEVTGLSVKPISIPEGAWCEYWYVNTDEGEIANPYYYWQELMEVTLTFSDGTTATGTGASIMHNGISYQLHTSDYQDYGIEPWTAGNTYSVEVYTADREVATETTVKITSSQIKSISFNDITIMENTCGSYWEEEDENGEYVEYYHYNWNQALNWTVTFKDGKKLSGTGMGFEYKDNYYHIGISDTQWAGEPWLAGNTYTGYAYVGSIRKSVDVNIRGTTEELAQVQNLRITSVGETSLKIKFDAVEDADRYEIYVNGSYWGNTTKTTYTVSGLTLGYGYDISVAASKKVDGKWYCGPASESTWGYTYRDISDYYVKLEYTSTVYDGTAKCPEITLKKTSSGKAIASEHYGHAYGMNTEVGQAWAEVYGIGAYGGYVLKDFKILPQQVTGVEVVEITSDSVTITFDPVEGATEYWVYQGSTRKAKITDTTYTYTGLKAGTTYKFSVRANAVVQEMKPDMEIMELVPDEIVDYTGKASATVSAKPVYRLEECTVLIKDPIKAYTGKKVTNSFTVKNAAGKTLKKNTDYTISYENNKEMGIATAILKGKGKYAGEITEAFIIGPKAVKDVEVDVINGTTLEVSFDEMKGAYGYIVFVDGVAYGTTLEDECIIEGLTAGQKYSITVRAVVEIENEEIPMVPGAESKAVTATPRHKMSICSVDLSEDGFTYTGKTHKPAVTVYGYEGAELTEGVDYTLSYKNNKNTGKAYVEIKGKGAYTGTIKEYYIINPAAVTDLKVSSTTKTSVKISFKKASSNSTKYYNVYVNGEKVGRTTSSSYTIKNLTLGEVYSVYVVPEKTVSRQTYYGQPSEILEVWPGTGIGSYKATLDFTKADFTGEALCPGVVVKTSSKSSAKTLVEGVDYIVTYENNVGPGKAKLIIQGIGIYTGTITKTFKINPPQVTNVTATALSKTSIEVSFDAAPGATSYWVYVNGSRKAKITDTSCVITGLKKNKTYKITVKAVATVDGESYTSDYTDAVSCKTPSK